METLISSIPNLQSVPEVYLLPASTRPGSAIAVPTHDAIPVIDFSAAPRSTTVQQQLMHAVKEYGFFQLINHGLSEELLQDVLKVSSEFMELPAEEKAGFVSDDLYRPIRLGSSVGYGEANRYWRDYFRHPAYPLHDHIHSWPQNPPRYREVMGRFSKEAREVSMLLLEMICEGIGLEKGYLSEVGKVQMMCINLYPPCPDPTSTLGLPKHCDIPLINLLIQGGVNGLEIFKDGQWFGIDPLPNAFIVNTAQALRVISNGSTMSLEHRVVNNKGMARMTVVSCIHPSGDSWIEAAKELVNDSDKPPLFRPFMYKSLFSTNMTDIEDDVPPLDRHLAA